MYIYVPVQLHIAQDRSEGWILYTKGNGINAMMTQNNSYKVGFVTLI